MLLSRSYTGGIPNGPSGAPEISRDDRRNSVAVFESDADNIVPGDLNGVTDVFLVHRKPPFSSDGSPWHVGDNALVSHGMAGQPANGRSYAPSVDGSVKTPPSCVAFVSDASNLVPGDTNGVADAFVYDVASGQITRVSVSSRGEQANGPSFQVAVSGDCGRIAFTSTATNLALTRTHRAAWRGGQSAPVPVGHRQVYVRFLGHHPLDAGFAGMTAVASVSNSSRPGNGDSYDPAFASSGKALAFVSQATNLSRRDRATGADVYARMLARKFVHLGHGRGTQSLLGRTRLVSITRKGRAGNGPCGHPSLSAGGRWVAYDSAAANLVRGDHNRASDVFRADLSTSPARQVLVSKTQHGQANGPSSDASISDAGHFVAFDTAASNLRMFPYLAPDTNGVRDVAVGIIGLRSSSVESLTSSNGFATAPSAAPSLSARGNYMLFQSADPHMDSSIPNPGLKEVYLRYLGPKGS